MKTIIVPILDRSGSMNGREADVIGGVNKFIDEQQKLPDEAAIAFVRFDDQGVERFRVMGDLKDCKPLTKDEYIPRGGTPLLDAIGRTITEMEEDWKREKPGRAIVVIVTDGQENASKEYSKEKIKQMIQSREASGMWAFIYLGANVDAFDEAGAMGFRAANTAGYKATTKGMAAMYDSASVNVSEMRRTGHTMAASLGGNIDEDGNVVKPGTAAQQQTQKQQQPAADVDAALKPWVPPSGDADAVMPPDVPPTAKSSKSPGVPVWTPPGD